jgi:diguanylate cyclase
VTTATPADGLRTDVADVAAFVDFSDASRAVLDYLRTSVGLDLWMVTRTEGADWIILEATENAYGIASGQVFPWQDSFCSRMVEGAPNVAPRARDVPQYRKAAIAEQLDIGSYVGVPLSDANGELFGTLCAIDPGAQTESLSDRAGAVPLLAKLLGTVLRHELAIDATQRSVEILETQALTDALTGLANRRAWDAFVEHEEARCRRFGHPAAVIMIDLDGLKIVNDRHGHAAGDELLVRAGALLAETVRATDLAARLGGDEFAVLATESDAAAGDVLVRRLRERLRNAGVAASVGLALRPADGTLADAVREADAAMYRVKRKADS